MRVRIEVEGYGDVEPTGQVVDALSLYRWLGDDPDVGRDVGLSLLSREQAPASGESAPGYMGPGLDAIEAVFNGSVQLAQLALAVAAWRLARPRPPRVRLERAGTTVLLDSDDPEAIRRALAALEGPDPLPDPEREGDRPPAPRPDDQRTPPAASV
ncbi:hypothetical protein ACFVGN_35715 [Streptomyces sp. NPDC057757]|uniref:effector-associated constant component EACC1 n=1 Tax=Streptomyces sp. NPDC057757 TaxID=3346241 RepID=UPI0036BCB88D